MLDFKLVQSFQRFSTQETNLLVLHVAIGEVLHDETDDSPFFRQTCQEGRAKISVLIHSFVRVPCSSNEISHVNLARFTTALPPI